MHGEHELKRHLEYFSFIFLTLFDMHFAVLLTRALSLRMRALLSRPSSPFVIDRMRTDGKYGFLLWRHFGSLMTLVFLIRSDFLNLFFQS